MQGGASADLWIGILGKYHSDSLRNVAVLSYSGPYGGHRIGGQVAVNLSGQPFRCDRMWTWEVDPGPRPQRHLSAYRRLRVLGQDVPDVVGCARMAGHTPSDLGVPVFG
jgi:hypothetical protein